MSTKRRVDDLGRIVLPKDMRNALRYAKNQPIEIVLEEDKIVLRKTTDSCDLCGGEENLNPKGKYMLCSCCLSEITSETVSEEINI